LALTGEGPLLSKDCRICRDVRIRTRDGKANKDNEDAESRGITRQRKTQNAKHKTAPHGPTPH